MISALLALALGPGPGAGISPRQNPVVLRAPLTTSGTPFECGANAVACATWNGSALVDAKGNSWTQNGTVPQVAANASPFVPGTAGSTNYTDAIYYSLGTDAMNVAGDFSFCALFAPSVAALRGIAGAGDDATKGFFAEASTTTFRGFIAPSFDQSTAISGSWSVACLGRAGTAGYMKVNGAAIVTAATGTPVAATGITSKIGRLTSGGFPFGAGTLYAVWMSTDTPSDALFTRIQQRALGMIGSFGEPVTCTRASTATYTANALEWTAPANVCRFESSGLLVEPPHTNKFLNSDAPATQTITFATGNQVAWVTGAGNVALAVGTATATGLPCTAIAATPCLFNITGAGTVVATYTATLTFVDIGDGTYKSSAVHTLVAAVARSADIVTMQAPLAAGDRNYCLDVTFAPYGSRSWSLLDAALLSLGALGTANSTSVQAYTDGAAYFQTFDVTPTQKVGTVTHGFAAGSSHRLRSCNAGGTLSQTHDSTLQTLSISGSGTGVVDPAGTLYIGSDGSAGRVAGGYIKSVAISRSSDPVVF